MAKFNGPGIRVLKQYQGKDGKTYVQLSTGETLDTDSEEYRDYFDEGVLYGEDEKGNFYPQEGAHETLNQYQKLVAGNSFENYMKPYFEDEMTGTIARGLGQSEDKFWDVNSSYKQSYDDEMRKQFVNQFLSQNPKLQEDEERGPYIDRISRSLPNEVSDYILDSGNPELQPSYWSDFGRGVDSVQNEILPSWLGGGGDSGLINDIRSDSSYSIRERNGKINDIQQGRYGFIDRSKDQLGLLSPLVVPAKFVQSMYKDDYSFEDVVAGRKNNANIVEDLVTDPLTYASFGAGKAASSVASKLPEASQIENYVKNTLELVYKEAGRLKPNQTSRAAAALEEGNQWSKNWYTNPEFKTRLDNIKSEMSNSYDETLNAINPNTHRFENLNKEKSRVNQFWNELGDNVDDGNYQSIFQSDKSKLDRLLEGKPHLHTDNSGTSYGEYSRPDAYSPMGTNGTQNFVDRTMNPERIASTAVHEGNHGIATPRMLSEVQPAPSFNRMFREPFQEAIETGKADKYYTNPLEIYARIQEFRRFNKIKPGQTVTPEEVKAMTEVSNKSSQINRPFLNMFDPETMSKLLNKLPAAGAGAALPAWLLNQEPDQSYID